MLFISGIQKFDIVALFLPFLFFNQPFDNLFLTVKTIFNWNFKSIATSTVQSFMAKYLRKECGDLNEVVSDNDDGKDDGDDDDPVVNLLKFLKSAQVKH